MKKDELVLNEYPLVSVVLICYNHELYIEECILSVFNQTYPNIELIIVDDHSTDGSVAILKRLQTQKNLKLFENERNVGLQPNIIIGIENATGEYISLLASDDFITHEKIEKQIKHLLSTGNEGVYGTGYLVNGQNRTLIKLHKIFRHYTQSKALRYVYTHDYGAPLSQSALFKREILLDNMDLRRRFKQDDWPLLIKSMECYKIGYIDEPLFGYRIHSTNMHKGYWKTLPNRIEVISLLIPEKYRLKALANIFLSHGQYHLMDKKIWKGFRIFWLPFFSGFLFLTFIVF